jgi:hypothetical protein
MPGFSARRVVAECDDGGVPVLDERPENCIHPVHRARDPVTEEDDVEENPSEGEKRCGPEALVEHEELGGGGLEGFQVVRGGEDVERREERKADPRREEGREHQEEPHGNPQLELPVHDPRATTILDRAQIRLPLPFLLF